MRLTRRHGSGPGWVLAVGMACSGACGPAVSLDDPGEGSGAPITSGGPFGPTSGVDGDATQGADDFDDGVRLDLGSIKLDVAPDVPLPPGMCPPDCQFELNLAWTYDGFGDDPPGPLDPEDQVAVLVEPGGTIVVVQERLGAITLARLEGDGQELWTFPLPLPCDPCRVVDLGLHPSGDLLLAAYGVDESASPAALAARVELGAPELQWVTLTALTPGLGVVPRAGTLVAHDEDLVLQPVLDGSLDDGLERLELWAYDAATGGLLQTTPLAAGLGTGNAPPPRAAYDAGGLLVLTQPVWADGAGLGGEIRWLVPLDATVEQGERIEPSLRLAAAPGGRMLTLGHTLEADTTLLQLGSGHSGDPEQWTLAYAVQTVTASSPALAVDTYGDAHVVVRTAQGEPGHERAVELLVLRWSDEGTLVWKLALPLAFERVNEPISLALTASEDLLLAGFVGGVRHVERRVANCNCG